MAITTAEKVLITGGVLNLAYGVLLGYAAKRHQESHKYSAFCVNPSRRRC
jgi:hypothetical protein